MTYSLLLGLVVGLSVLFFWIGRRAAHTNPGLSDQVNRYLEDNPDSLLQGSAVVTAAREPSFFERVLAPGMRSGLNRLGSLTPARGAEGLAKKLDTAGHPMGLTALNFLGLKFISAMIGAVVGALVFMLVLKQSLTFGLLFALVFGILGFYIPNFWLSSVIRRRQREIVAIRAGPHASHGLLRKPHRNRSLVKAKLRSYGHCQTKLNSPAAIGQYRALVDPGQISAQCRPDTP